MAEHDVISPLIPKGRLSQPRDEPLVIITVDDVNRGSESLSQSSNRTNTKNDQTSSTHLEIENPFEFLGARPLDVPATSTVDPFRNHTPTIEGVYEWLKILICVPIAIVRLVLFGLSLLVGFVATKFALQGWKDKQNPMPTWRCRLMCVTRICARCSLFSFGMQETIQRYKRHTKDVRTDNSLVEENMQHLKHEAADMAKKIELLEVAKRKLLGEGLGSCTMEELKQIEQQLERSISKVRAKKAEVFSEQIDRLKEKEKFLVAENAKLCEKYGLQLLQESDEEREAVPYTESSENSDVETELFIGLPEGSS